MTNIHKLLYKKSRAYRWIVNHLRQLVLPGFQGVPLWYVIRFFSQQLANEIISLRASAVAFNFFLALVPALMFVFTLIPYFPINNLDENVMALLRDFMPDAAYKTLEDTIKDILVKRRSGLLSIGFLFTIYFATNGIYSLLDAFNQEQGRPFTTKWLISFSLMLVLTFLLVIGISVYIIGEIFLYQIVNNEVLQYAPNYYLLQSLHVLIIVGIIFVAVSLLYFVGPAQRSNRPRLFSPGSIIATLLMVLTSYGFAYYVENFSQYNKFYGSLGTLIILMIWLYINAIVLIVGFEINQSIALAKKHRSQLLGK